MVGAGLAGWSVITELRGLGHQGPIILCGDEQRAPYGRPPLSKQFLRGEVDEDSLTLGRPDDGEARVRLVDRAAAVGPRQVRLGSGELIDAEFVVVATGAKARRLAAAEHPDTMVLRTLTDAGQLRSRLAARRHLVVLGGGFVGAEVATAARLAGMDVTMIEQQHELFASSLGSECGRRLRELHEADGVVVRRSVTAVSVTGPAGAPRVLLSDGTELTADVVLVAVGAVPDTSVLAGSGLDLAGGVKCDADGRIDGMSGAFAVGDAACWFDPVLGRHVRREHWSTAIEHASIVAHTILGLALPPGLRAPPYVWSDQVGTTVQVLGRPELADTQIWRDVPGHPSRTMLEYRRGTSLVAAAVVGAPRLLRTLRRELVEAETILLTKES